jgi:haloacid dehalogenase-like hydrolase
MRYMLASHHRAMLRVLALSIVVIASVPFAAPRLNSKEVHLGVANAAQADPLPSWNEGEPKRNIITFVQSVADQNGPDYVPPAARIAVFDNDGTLWSEQPLYVQLAFALDRVKALAPEHPEWRTTQPFQAVLEDDHQALGAAGVKGLIELVVATHTGMTSDEFDRTAKDWLATARHPRFNRLYTDIAYQPMVELLGYLRANGFKTYIVSGGGIEFMRVISEQLYGIPPEQVIGSSGKIKYELWDGVPVIVRLPELDFFDDKEGKPVAIQKFIGRRPIAAFGNSDGDLQMLQWTAAGPGRRLMLLVDHTDAEREFLYRVSPIGRLELALDEAHQRGWTLVSMKDDWKRIFAFE